jgi:hypothetical protein
MKQGNERQRQANENVCPSNGKRIALLTILFVIISVNQVFAQRDLTELNKIASFEKELVFVNPYFGMHMNQLNLNALSGKTYSVFVKKGCEDMYEKILRAYNLRPSREFYCSSEEISFNIAMGANQAANALFIVKQSDDWYAYSNSRWLVLLDDPRNILPRKK